MFACLEVLVAGAGGSGRASALRHADITRHFVLADAVHNKLIGLAASARVVEDRLVHGALALFRSDIVHGERHVELILLLIHAAQLDSNVAYLLGLAAAVNRELD